MGQLAVTHYKRFLFVLKSYRFNSYSTEMRQSGTTIVTVSYSTSLLSAPLLFATLTVSYSYSQLLSCQLFLLSATLTLSYSTVCYSYCPLLYSQLLYCQLFLLSATLTLSYSTVCYSYCPLLYSQLLYCQLLYCVGEQKLVYRELSN